ncbi:MAG: class I SAM-dependent methyltransferase [Elusimicrobia bacterium]|nr:class I SAM-dependent methyltransferase [Elusimicrobiota bacterium]
MLKTAARRIAGDLAYTDDARTAARLREANRRRHFRELAESWDLWYELFFHKDPPDMTRAEYEALSQREADRLRPYLSPESRFLDLGCGGGRILRRVAPWCAEAHGADISNRALEHAREACRAHANVRLHLVADWTLDVGGRPFDLVFCHLMLSHVDVEPAVAYLQEVRRVLKPAGRLVFDLPNLLHPDNLSGLLRPESSNWPSPHRHRYWTEEMARAVCGAAGFFVEEIAAGRFLEIRASRAQPS